MILLSDRPSVFGGRIDNGRRPCSARVPATRQFLRTCIHARSSKQSLPAVPPVVVTGNASPRVPAGSHPESARTSGAIPAPASAAATGRGDSSARGCGSSAHNSARAVPGAASARASPRTFPEAHPPPRYGRDPAPVRRAAIVRLSLRKAVRTSHVPLPSAQSLNP